VEDLSLCEHLQLQLEKSATDNEQRAHIKVKLRGIFNVSSGMLDSLSSGLTNAYEDPKKAVNVARKLFQCIVGHMHYDFAKRFDTKSLEEYRY
jgi:hypothetical protein